MKRYLLCLLLLAPAAMSAEIQLGKTQTPEGTSVSVLAIVDGTAAIETNVAQCAQKVTSEIDLSLLAAQPTASSPVFTNQLNECLASRGEAGTALVVIKVCAESPCRP